MNQIISTHAEINEESFLLKNCSYEKYDTNGL